MWKRHPHVLSIDNTYKVNRFNMPLCEFNSVTALKATYNIAFCLLHDEQEASFTWALTQLNALAAEISLDITTEVLVAITDDDQALKNSLQSTLPTAQQQLCLWHIQKNVLAYVKDYWVGPPQRQEPTANTSRDVRMSIQDLVDNDDSDEPDAADAASPADVLNATQSAAPPAAQPDAASPAAPPAATPAAAPAATPADTEHSRNSLLKI